MIPPAADSQERWWERDDKRELISAVVVRKRLTLIDGRRRMSVFAKRRSGI